VDGFRHTFLQPSLGSEETRPHCLLLAFSQREVKDLEQMLLILHRGIQRWQREQGNSENGYPPLEILLCNWEHFKAYPAQNVLKLYEGLKNRGYYANDSVSWKVQADWREGIKQISSRSNQQKVLAIGSLYFLGQVRDYLIGTAGLHPD
jgi:folylpolyglutamate synthase/dihydropteroate synthase